MYEIRVASSRRLIQSTLSGFLSVAEVEAYARSMEEAHRQAFRFRPTYRLVVDARDARIQAQDVLAAFAAHIATFPVAERIAIVIGLSLNRFQILRLLDRPYARTCDTLEDARAWVLDGLPIEDAELIRHASNADVPA